MIFYSESTYRWSVLYNRQNMMNDGISIIKTGQKYTRLATVKPHGLYIILRLTVQKFCYKCIK